MTLRTKLIDLLGGDLPDTDHERTGDLCIDEGHDVVELRAATSTEPLGRQCRRCKKWFDDKGNVI